MDERPILEVIHHNLLSDKHQLNRVVKTSFELLSEDEQIRVKKSLAIPREDLQLIFFDCDEWWIWLPNKEPVNRLFITINLIGIPIVSRINFYKFWRRLLRGVEHPTELLERLLLTYF